MVVPVRQPRGAAAHTSRARRPLSTVALAREFDSVPAMQRRRWLVIALATGCAAAGSGISSDDAPPEDAPPSCQMQQTFYRDADGDGHGDRTQPMAACTKPDAF